MNIVLSNDAPLVISNDHVNAPQLLSKPNVLVIIESVQSIDVAGSKISYVKVTVGNVIKTVLSIVNVSEPQLLTMVKV